MISVKNYYESITCEEPFTSHKNENQLELLNNYYLGPISNNTQTTREVNKINTENLPDKDNIQSSTTNHIYQNIQKKTATRNSLDNSISLRKPEKQRNSTTRS